MSIPSCVQASCHDSVIAEFDNDMHNETFYEALTNDTIAKAGSPNEACIACHTGVNIISNLTWTKTASTIYINATGDPSGWTFVSFEYAA